MRKNSLDESSLSYVKGEEVLLTEEENNRWSSHAWPRTTNRTNTAQFRVPCGPEARMEAQQDGRHQTHAHESSRPTHILTRAMILPIKLSNL